MKIIRVIKFIPYLPQTLYFNFHYLPLMQAIKLPIILYKPHLLKCKGKLVLDTNKVKFGMIELGTFRCRVYPNSGFTWSNDGGTCVFKGGGVIGNNTFVMIAKKGYFEIGDNFKNNAGIKITCHNRLIIKDNLRAGWEVIMMDSPMHCLKNVDGSFRPVRNDGIVIGSNNWIATQTLVLNGAKTPDYCIIGARSVVNKDYSALPQRILMAGSPLTVKKEGIWRDVYDDILE